MNLGRSALLLGLVAAALFSAAAEQKEQPVLHDPSGASAGSRKGAANRQQATNEVGTPAQRTREKNQNERFNNQLERAEREADRAASLASLMEVQLGVVNWTLLVLGVVGSGLGLIAGLRLSKHGKDLDSMLEAARKTQTEAEAKVRNVEHAAAALLQRAESASGLAEQIASGAKERVDRAIKETLDAVDAVKSASVQVQTIEANVQGAMDTLAEIFERRPSFVLGAPKKPPAQKMIDADAVMVLADQLGLAGKDRNALAAYFVMVGRCWYSFGEYRRSLGRLERAIELRVPSPVPDPQAAEAHAALARLLWVWAKEDPKNDERSEWLLRAQRAVEESYRLLGEHTQDTLHSLAVLADENNQPGEAEARLNEARLVSRGRALALGRVEDFDLTYSMACLHARYRKFPAALSELQAIIDRSERTDDLGRVWPVDYRADARRDSDFDELRKDPVAGPAFEALCRPRGD